MKYRLKIPAKGFGTVYADPPWMLKTGSGKRKLVYDTMETQEIADLGGQLNEPFVLRQDAHLWLWSTNPHLPEAFGVMRAWEFDYKTMMTWDKGRIGLGWWLRSRTEHVLLGVKTYQKHHYRVQPNALSTLLRAPYRGHSVKPLEVYDIIEKLSPGPYLELFAGVGQEREGWTMLSSRLPPHGGPYGTGHTPDQQCGGCPHRYHPTGICSVDVPKEAQWHNLYGHIQHFSTTCPCSYDIDEGSNDRLPMDTRKGIVEVAHGAKEGVVTW